MSELAALELAGVDIRPQRRLPMALEGVVRPVREKRPGLGGAAPVVAPYGAGELGAGPRLDGPSLSHLFGTDNLGRDVFSRVVHGAQVSMTIGFLAVFFSTLIS